MSEPAFFALQRAFSAYLRNPAQHDAPANVDSDGLAVYANAVFANMAGFLGDNFPLIKAIMPAAAWHAMVRDFVQHHASSTPLFAELPGEFLAYLARVRDATDDPPYLAELAHFEWLENAVATHECAIGQVAADATGDVMTGVPVMNPTARLEQYAYPVHTVTAAGLPAEAPPNTTYIVAFRDRNDEYGFIDLNAATARVVELLIAPATMTGDEVMRQLAAELRHPDVNAVIAGGRAILERFRTRHLVLGTAPAR